MTAKTVHDDGTPCLEIRGLCKSYPAFALRDVSFSVPQGAIMGFIGRNGAYRLTR